MVIPTKQRLLRLIKNKDDWQGTANTLCKQELPCLTYFQAQRLSGVTCKTKKGGVNMLWHSYAAARREGTGEIHFAVKRRSGRGFTGRGFAEHAGHILAMRAFAMRAFAGPASIMTSHFLQIIAKVL